MGRALALSDGAGFPALVAASAIPSINAAKETTDAPVLSPGVFPANLHGMRRCFPDMWGAFLRAHFQNATHVAAFFDVDHHTARAWMNGKHGATAPVALYAIQRIPGALAMLTQGEAA